MTLFNLVIGIIIIYIVLALLGLVVAPLAIVGSKLWWVLIILIILAVFARS